MLKDSLPGGRAQWGSVPEAAAQFKQDKLEIWYQFMGEAN